GAPESKYCQRLHLLCGSVPNISPANTRSLKTAQGTKVGTDGTTQRFSSVNTDPARSAIPTRMGGHEGAPGETLDRGFSPRRLLLSTALEIHHRFHRFLVPLRVDRRSHILGSRSGPFGVHALPLRSLRRLRVEIHVRIHPELLVRQLRHHIERPLPRRPVGHQRLEPLVGVDLRDRIPYGHL